MHVSSFILMVCAVVLAGWSVIWLRNRVLERRRRARQADWEDLARHYSGLDRELDRVWYRR